MTPFFLRFRGLLITCALYFIGANANAQPAHYSISNTHSHNDYEQAHPFSTAHQAQFGSIEADIFLVNNKLLVAHSPSELSLNRSLEGLYLKPVLQALSENGNFPYPDTSRQLQMLIDIKTDSVKTLDALISLLKKYPDLTRSPKLKWVISGNRPAPDHFDSYPDFIWFDGELKRTYSEKALSRILMMSDNLARYTRWKGKEPLPENDRLLLEQIISKAHRLGKTVRFWNAPDFKEAWETLISLGVDYINTDHIEALSQFLNSRKR
ncbi:MAG TPA: phosphatidylinositol-specific phospholipase C/glycerophosphodiester phosphodiesterase family protein [Puia sp.]